MRKLISKINEIRRKKIAVLKPYNIQEYGRLIMAGL